MCLLIFSCFALLHHPRTPTAPGCSSAPHLRNAGRISSRSWRTYWWLHSWVGRWWLGSPWICGLVREVVRRPPVSPDHVLEVLHSETLSRPPPASFSAHYRWDCTWPAGIFCRFLPCARPSSVLVMLGFKYFCILFWPKLSECSVLFLKLKGP